MRRIGLLVLFTFCFTLASFATVRRVCYVQYAIGYGWSQVYTMQVEFMTGMELNNATRSYSYDGYKRYCLLWFSNGGVAINEISDGFLCGYEFDDDAFRSLFYFRYSTQCVQINSQADEAPVWRITAKTYSGEFVDTREN